jgi:hypothetical protein
MSKEKAREYFVKGCNEYLRLFCEKHDFDYEEAKDSWVANCVGDITCVGDIFVGMQTIITDIEMDAPEEEFIKWYDYNLVAREFGFTTPNFDSWLRGCPRVSDETFKKLQGLKNDLDNAILEEQASLLNP